MQITDFIDSVASKYGYDMELIEALKRCVPVMVQGKKEEDIKLLMDTLERVQIYTFNEPPKNEEIEEIKRKKINGRNDHVKTVTLNKGEYGKKQAYGAYVNEPIFDDQMNIIDRVGFIYLTNLNSNSEVSKFYGTKINLSHLIHELGHAWAAQKGEFHQEKKGDYTMMVGTAKFHNKVDRKIHTVIEVGMDGLYIEEALNSIEEEETLYKMFGIKDFHDIPGYVQSNYQGLMTGMMRHYIEKLGEEVFSEIRIQKDTKEVEQFQPIFDETDFMKNIQDKEYYTNKKKALDSAQNTSMSDESKKRIKDFFEKYKELYLMPHRNKDFLEHLDRVMEQLFNFSSIKYSYNILEDDNRKAYQQTQVAILAEGYVPVNQVAQIIQERKQTLQQLSKISNLVKEALESGIRNGELDDIEAQYNINEEEKKPTDEQSL